MSSSFHVRYLQAVSKGLQDIHTRILSDREEGTTLTSKWELSEFIRLDHEFLPEEGVSPHATITFQQVSSTLSEYAIRRLFMDHKIDDVRKDYLGKAEMLYEVYLEKLDHEVI